jgi:hypothetical protein
MRVPPEGGIVLEAKVTVSRRFSRNGLDIGFSSQSEETISIDRFVTEPGIVSLKMGMTINLGHFEFAHVEAGLVLPCYSEEHEIASEYVRKFVEKRVLEEAREARNFAQNRLPK